MANFLAKLPQKRKKLSCPSRSKNNDSTISNCSDFDVEHFCPQCGAILEMQEGFSPTLDTWFCKECRQFLFGDIKTGEVYPDVMWFCDRCKELLNKQSGFNDTELTWICAKCGYVNKLDTIIESKNPFNTLGFVMKKCLHEGKWHNGFIGLFGKR